MPRIEALKRSKVSCKLLGSNCIHLQQKPSTEKWHIIFDAFFLSFPGRRKHIFFEMFIFLVLASVGDSTCHILHVEIRC